LPSTRARSGRSIAVSDIVCYPKRLLALVQKWREAGTVGASCARQVPRRDDFDAMRAFAAIPGSRLLHLHHKQA